MASPEPLVWLDGVLLPVQEARISPWDSGFTTGFGAFETLRAYRGVPFAATRHWWRLEHSCSVLGLRAPTLEQFVSAMSETLSANNLQEARVRFTVSGGEKIPGSTQSGSNQTLVCAVTPAQRPDTPEQVVSCPWPRHERSPLAGAKTLSYAENLAALNLARSSGAGEAMFANTRGELCEGSASNVFLMHGGVLHTPPISSGCLPGVTRALVLECCRQEGIQVSESPLPAAALAQADEAFLTASIREVQPIASVDGKPLSKTVGPITRRVAGLFQNLASSQIDP